MLQSPHIERIVFKRQLVLNSSLLDDECVLHRIMGFKMKDIHSPTVPSQPVSLSSSTRRKSLGGLSLQDLMRNRTRVENELWALGSVLESVRQPTNTWTHLSLLTGV